MAMALFLGVAIAACGGDDESAAPAPAPAEEPAPPAAEPPAAEPPAEEPPPAEPDTGGGDPVAGKTLYQEAGCGNCHALADAGTTGAIGPNLDESMPSLELSIDRMTNGAGAMPAFLDQLGEEGIADVAAYLVEATSS